MRIDTDSIRTSINIVDLIDGYVPLKKAGSNYMACCPFHGENTPSFTVSESKQFYHCFGCGAHGDVFDFVMEHDRVEFIDAVNMLTGGDHKKQDARLMPTVQQRLPLSQKSQLDQINETVINNDEWLKLTDIDGFIVSAINLSTMQSFAGRFIYGSLFAVGVVSGTVYITCDVNQAVDINALTGSCCICVFNPENIYFIVKALKRKQCKKIKVIVNNSAELIFADKMNMEDVYMHNLENKINMNDEFNLNKLIGE